MNNIPFKQRCVVCVTASQRVDHSAEAQPRSRKTLRKGTIIERFRILILSVGKREMAPCCRQCSSDLS